MIKLIVKLRKKVTNTYLKQGELPTTALLEEEYNREKYKFRYNKLLKSTFSVLLVIVAVSVLIATLFLPVLKIYGESMMPTFNKGDIVVSIKKSNFNSGDIIAFYYNNRILVKRVIAKSSEWVNIDDKGNVYVDDKLLVESYVKEKSLGESDIDFPYQVPDETYFVLGDLRESSVDSRSSLIGTIKEDDIIGKVIFRVWPLNRFSIVR